VRRYDAWVQGISKLHLRPFWHSFGTLAFFVRRGKEMKLIRKVCLKYTTLQSLSNISIMAYMLVFL
jgi:hypothetical protein